MSAHKIAQRLGADAALSGKVLVYQERAGAVSMDPPAAVGFEVKLVASDGMVLWRQYYEKQRPMGDRRFCRVHSTIRVFVTADELAGLGAAELADVFPLRWHGGGALADLATGVCMRDSGD